MDVQSLSDWLASYPASGKAKILTLIYSRLTIHTRQLFLPEPAVEKTERILEILHGLNEVHHTLANWLSDYAMDQEETFPVHVLSEQLIEIEKKYRIEHFLTPAIEYIRNHSELGAGGPGF
jgi:hypothetical protein